MSKAGKPRKRRWVRKLILALVVLLILAGAGWYAWQTLRQEYTVTYDSYTATTGSISNSLSFSGNLSLIDSATYTASSSSSVKTIYKAVGEEVQEDDKLLRLANGETITAGFDGRVNTLSVEEGDDVTPGDSLVQIADFKHMKVTFRVDEYDISEVEVGQACTITVTSLERSFDSTVKTIDYISASSGNVAYYSATAYVDVDDGVLPGMQVTVSIPQEEAKDVVILKVDALSFDVTNQAFVYMKDENGELQQVNVTTGVSNGNYIEITDGLKDGDEVFVEAQVVETAGGLLAGLFGRQQFNQPSGGGMPGGGSFPSGDFDPSSFGDGNFPSRDSGSSGRSSGGSSGGFPGGGSFPGMGGGNG